MVKHTKEIKVQIRISLTSGSSSQRAFLTVGTRLSANESTISRDVEDMISDRPTHTPCRVAIQ